MDGITLYGRYFNVITMNTQSQKVSMAEKIGYSLGDCSANLVFQMMMIYQTKFYTDIFGLEGAIAGTVMLVAASFAFLVASSLSTCAWMTSSSIFSNSSSGVPS